MNREYMCAYHSLLETMEQLTDAEFGRLLRVALRYSRDHEVEEVRGREAMLWPVLRWQIDRDNAAFEAKCQQNRANGQRGGRPSTRETDRIEKNRTVFYETEKTHNKDKDKDKDKDTNITPPTPLAPLPGASPELCDAFAAWLSYKRERREAYKATGLQALMSRIQTAAGQYGEHAVAELIRDCMAANWKGIIFDRLKNAPPPSRQQRASWADLAAQMDAEEAYQ